MSRIFVAGLGAVARENRIAGFQTCESLAVVRLADLEIGDTAGLETCDTVEQAPRRCLHPQPGTAALRDWRWT